MHYPDCLENRHTNGIVFSRAVSSMPIRRSRYPQLSHY
jgi:hypothetical protein